ncbi:FAD-dependent pyridine nucleotide-disulfide oxidoreductase [Corynebacterium suranareeae]|uniref:FAD-dependent pyridine nucleotide-disulfide oxidoreductase n=1 Tax=Corynebacterium suranareeae TaxID=2506452 RepID=A0A161JLT4_9CORY|nr:FAD-dependent oxidoreductase [Corynebacterium suranareeae]BAU94438.1 FAD-dependent pyridine nucleotide-disulfide oxidoreductase [Corynebacterium suranareeae]
MNALIIGAGAAGLAVAEALAERDWEGEITLVGQENYVPYDRPPLSKALLSGEQEFDFVSLCSEENLQDNNITLVKGKSATSLDSTHKFVNFDDGSRMSFDKLIIATGVDARELPATQHIDAALTLRTFEDSMKFRGLMTEGSNILIVGAGFIGLEVAATAILKGCTVHVVEPSPGVLYGKFPDVLSERIRQSHEEKGVNFHFGQVVEHWNAPGGVLESVTLSDGTTITADAALVGIGTIPATGWLADSGLPIANGIMCDAQGLAAEDIYAVGDVSNWFHPLIGENRRIEHRLSAGEQAQIVAAQLTGTNAPALDLPFFWTDQYKEKWQAYGYVDWKADIEIVHDDKEANKLVAVLRKDGVLEAVIGKNAVKQLMPYRRELKLAAQAADAATL